MNVMDIKLIDAYGGKLVDLAPTLDEQAELKQYASKLPTLQVSNRSLCDLELIATGLFRRSTIHERSRLPKCRSTNAPCEWDPVFHSDHASDRTL